jgi:pentatricopeptide repeat protein
MQQERVEPDTGTFVGILNACASVGALEEGKLFHEQIVQRGFESAVFVGSSVVNMYAKYESMEEAQRVFNKMPSLNVVSWNVMILAHMNCGQGQEALELFRQMQQEGVQPNPVTFVAVLNACASLVAIEEDRHAHEQIIHSG